jgi:hypothetical protein
MNYFLVINLLLLIITNNWTIREKNEDIFKKLSQEIDKKSFSFSYDTLSIKNIRIIKPNFPEKHFGQSLIDNDLKELLKMDYCEELGKAFINYRITQITKNFISIIKEVEEQFCPHYASDSYYSETLNLIKINQVTYQIKGSTFIRKEIFSLAKNKLPNSCMTDTNLNIISIDLFFKNGKLYALNPFASRQCELTIQLNLKKRSVEFFKIGVY